MNVLIIEKSVAQRDAAMNIRPAASQNKAAVGRKTARKYIFLFFDTFKAVCKEIHIKH